MAVTRISLARKAAFGILLNVERGAGHSDDLLRGAAVDALAPADRNLVTALVLGTLRWQIALDERIRPWLKRPAAKLDPEILIALRLGAFQLLHLDRIPAHAAIGESVELAKKAGHRFAAGMVNAVLRKLASGQSYVSGHGRGTHPVDGSSADQAAKTTRASAPAPDLAGEYAHPAWLVDRWERYYGAEAASAICAHGQTQPKLAIRLADPSVEAELAQAGFELAPGELLTAARTVIAGDLTTAQAFREGRVRIQDEGSQLVGEIAAFCTPKDLDQKVKSIVDACAAPGGKTLILAERNPEARIVACEASAQRMAAMQARLAAHSDRIECRLADAAALAEDSVHDLALADVPCSGTGTLGRNPEIRHRLRAEDLPRQGERQRAILHAALRAVRSGGCVVYSTCSLEPEENEQVVAAVLVENSGARQVSLADCLERMQASGVLAGHAAERLAQCLTPEGALHLLPGVLGTDGFFVALIERSA